MNKTIEITKVVAVGDTIQYEICDSTGLSLLKPEGGGMGEVPSC